MSYKHVAYKKHVPLCKNSLNQREKCFIDAVERGDVQSCQSAIADSLRRVYSFASREGQLDALLTLINEEQNLLSIAKTSFSKSLILQVFPLLTGKVAIINLLLKQIGEEQATKIEAIGGKPCVLTPETMSNHLLKRIQSDV